MNQSVRDVVIATLKEMGRSPAPGTLFSTFALGEGRRLVAQNFIYEGGCAVWLTQRGTVSFYGKNGGLLIEKNVIKVYDNEGRKTNGDEKAA